MVGAWGDEELIEQAFAIEEYDRDSTVEIGPLTATFAEVPHYILTHAVNLVSSAAAASPSAPTAAPARSWSTSRATPTCCSSRRRCRGPSAPGSAAISPPRRPAITRAAPGPRRVVLTHISDELDAEWAREEGSRAFGGPVDVARAGDVFEL